MDNSFLTCRGSSFVSYSRAGTVSGKVAWSTGRTVTEAVIPGKPYRVFGIVAFEVIYDEEIARSKAPDVACPGTIGIGSIDLVNPPEVRRIQCKLTGVIAFLAKSLCLLVLR